MKLYFYFLDTYSRNPKGLCVEEREAEEKPKTYKAVDGIFPNGYGAVRKDDVGRITDFDRMFLTEPNFEYVKDKFKKRAESRIAQAKEKLEREEKELKIIEESEE